MLDDVNVQCNSLWFGMFALMHLAVALNQAQFPAPQAAMSLNHPKLHPRNVTLEFTMYELTFASLT